MTTRFNCGSMKNLRPFKGANHYHNFLNLLFRVDKTQKYTNEKTKNNFCWFPGDASYTMFPEGMDERMLLSHRDCLVKHPARLSSLCFEDISPDCDDGIAGAGGAEVLFQTWKNQCSADLLEHKQKPLLFVYHEDVFPTRPLRFYVVCEDMSSNRNEKG